MRLAEVIERVPGARLATPDDNARILDFFDRSPMQTSAFALLYRRSPDFFRLLRHQGNRAHVLIFVNDRGCVTGLGTLSLREGWVDGRATTVGTLGDLRIGFSRDAIAHWRRLVSDVIARSRDIDEVADCTHWLTTIMDDNRLARRVLVEGRPDAPVCVPIAPFTMRNIIARTPLARPKDRPSRWRVRRAGPADEERLTGFFETENSRLRFGFRGELPRRLVAWDGLDVNDFIIASVDDSIIACAAPWSASAAKQMFVSTMPLAMRLLGLASVILPGGMLRVPRPGEPLRVAYLTHLAFSHGLADADRLEVFRMMVDLVFDGWPNVDWHCLAFADFPEWNLGRALHGYVQQAVPITIYAVLPPGSSADIVRSPSDRPPAFEMATV